MPQLKKTAIIFLCLLFSVFSAACDNYPKDESQTLENIYQREEIHIGVIYNPPWTDHTNKNFYIFRVDNEFNIEDSAPILFHVGSPLERV